MSWICMDCGIKYGNRKPGVATWHIGKCSKCKKTIEVTETRDFGYLKEEL